MSKITKSNQSKWYVLVILTTVYAFNFIDRQILVILAEPIKADLGLSDTQLGLLTGLAFAALYVTMGLPIARLADKGNRKNIVAASLTLWSLMTAISGTVTSFFQLLLARIGVGIGEAGGSPPSHSIISDYFPPKKRATALAIYSMGIYIGILLGFVIGGVIAKLYGWRITFYAIGIPGILLAIILYFTIKEPIKGQSDAIGTSDQTPKLAEVIKTLFGSKSFVFAALGAGFIAFGTYGFGNFMPSFLQRVHGMDIASAGYALGLIFGVGGGVGTFLGGYFADRYGKKDVRWHLWIIMITGFAGYIPFAMAIFSGDVNWVLAMTFLAVFLLAFNLAPVIAVTHSLVNARMRAFASSILFLILNLIGLGLGPLAMGYLSDLLTPNYGDLSLRWAFCIIFLSGSIATVFFGLAAKNYKEDLKRIQHNNDY
ncbi:spinster family MFS transporter [Flagellimonas pacifica]|uniref:Predicted arabinose efflux permease, MFS family n=1 Tax=Flagellimonas pacifica TaxID=1247520 RepID=A0A285N066_9FLAO|nr:MFS transporter [Allomuricauda parva]SNZ01416.1 Predicted arabinose efflux permease, MFS family [Allomuricauda parva]